MVSTPHFRQASSTAPSGPCRRQLLRSPDWTEVVSDFYLCLLHPLSPPSHIDSGACNTVEVDGPREDSGSAPAADARQSETQVAAKEDKQLQMEDIFTGVWMMYDEEEDDETEEDGAGDEDDEEGGSKGPEQKAVAGRDPSPCRFPDNRSRPPCLGYACMTYSGGVGDCQLRLCWGGGGEDREDGNGSGDGEGSEGGRGGARGGRRGR